MRARSMLYTIGLRTLYVYVCTCMMSVSDHPACVSSLCGACDGRFDVCMRCCERSGLLGLWGCGPVSSPVIVPVRCLRAVKKVESSRVSPANTQHAAHTIVKPAEIDRPMQCTDAPAENRVRRASSAAVVTLPRAYRDRRVKVSLLQRCRSGGRRRLTAPMLR